jgi:hypothetical protein
MLQECNGERERPKPRNVAFSIPLTASENPSRAAVYWVPFSIVTVCWCRSADVASLGTRRLESGAKEDRGVGGVISSYPTKNIERKYCKCVCVSVCSGIRAGFLMCLARVRLEIIIVRKRKIWRSGRRGRQGRRGM